jgi:hypothetical protein
MSKPILIVKANINPDRISDLNKRLSEQFFDYHVLIVSHGNFETPTFECFNDNKGLKNIDIKKLILDFSKDIKSA